MTCTVLLIITFHRPFKVSGWKLLRNFRIVHLCDQNNAYNHQSDCHQQGRGERTVSRFQRLHKVDKHHRSLPEELDQSVGGPFRCRVSDLGCILHSDRIGADEKETH